MKRCLALLLLAVVCLPLLLSSCSFVSPVKKLYVQAQKGKLRRFVKRVEEEKKGIIEDIKLQHEINK